MDLFLHRFGQSARRLAARAMWVHCEQTGLTRSRLASDRIISLLHIVTSIKPCLQQSCSHKVFEGIWLICGRSFCSKCIGWAHILYSDLTAGRVQWTDVLFTNKDYQEISRLQSTCLLIETVSALWHSPWYSIPVITQRYTALHQLDISMFFKNAPVSQLFAVYFWPLEWNLYTYEMNHSPISESDAIWSVPWSTSMSSLKWLWS